MDVNESNAHQRAGGSNKCVTNNKEYTMKKQGFTLIELMVVIVIMGILAAGAVPKLFAMIAKSKASEVGPAAGSYVHMQEAYFVDQQDIGTWNLIGYTAPTSTNFEYGGKDATSGKTWTATAQFDDDGKCTGDGGKEWSISVSKASGKITYVASNNCPALTPNFDKIGSGS